MTEKENAKKYKLKEVCIRLAGPESSENGWKQQKGFSPEKRCPDADRLEERTGLYKRGIGK